jgi:hypothetical protein
MDYLKKVKTLLKKSNSDDADDFAKLLEGFNPSGLKGLCDFFEKDLNNVKIIIDLYRQKKEFFKSHDKSLWDSILNQENEILKIINNN